MPAAAFSQSAIYIANLVPEESSTEFSIGHLVNTDKEVDKIMEQVQRAGAIIIKPAQKTFWSGYAGYFKDIDSHLWEIALNPALAVD